MAYILAPLPAASRTTDVTSLWFTMGFGAVPLTLFIFGNCTVDCLFVWARVVLPKNMLEIRLHIALWVLERASSAGVWNLARRLSHGKTVFESAKTASWRGSEAMF